MAVRIAALSVPRFYDEGIEVGEGWSAMPSELTDAQRAVLLGKVGALIQIHPDDVGNLGEHGFALVDGKLCEAGEAEADGDVPTVKRTTKKNKGAAGAGNG